MNAPLSTLASRALNAPSEAFLVRQACLNVADAASWRGYLLVCPEWWLRKNWHFLVRRRDTRPNRVLREYRTLAAKYEVVHSFKDAGVGK